jgi:uncharacterized protein (DUF302 family)
MTGIAAIDNGIIRIPSHHSVAETMDRLAAILKQNGVTVFARIDFSGDAARAGLTMRPEQLLIFGNPKAGTPLLVAAPTVGLDLPIRALIWQDIDGKVWIAYNDPQYVVRRHDLAPALAGNLAAVGPLLEWAARE